MINPPTVVTSADPSPLELIFAKKIRDALEHDSYAKEAAKVEGTFALKSLTDPQAVTFDCQNRVIQLSSGVANRCKLVIKVDLNNPAAKPKIDGLLKQPLLAIKAGKLLEFPEVSWADALKRFWEQHHETAGMPAGLTVKCIDEDRQLSVGQSEGGAYFEGQAAALSEAFSGSSPLIQLLATGRISGRFTMEQVTVMSGATVQMMLGET